MFFRTAFAFAIVSAISASLIALLGGMTGLSYLAGYTHRVAISNHRLVAFDHDQVTFRYKDYAQGNKNA